MLTKVKEGIFNNCYKKYNEYKDKTLEEFLKDNNVLQEKLDTEKNKKPTNKFKS